MFVLVENEEGERVSRKISLLLLLCAIGVANARGDECPAIAYDDSEGIVLTSRAGEIVTVGVKNPITDVASRAAAGLTPGTTVKDVRACWLTEQQLLAGKTCDDTTLAESREGPVPFGLGICELVDTHPKVTWGDIGYDIAAKLAKAPVIMLRYIPDRVTQGVDYLRLDWKEVAPAAAPAENNAETEEPPPADGEAHFKVMKVTTAAAPHRYDEDSRYRMWLYTGYSWFQSQSDFRDGYPDLRMRFETRLMDERLAMRKKNPERYAAIREYGRCLDKATKKVCTPADQNCRCGRPTFDILRLYGEVGLTGVSVETTTAGGTQSADRTRQALDSSVAVGLGKILEVVPENATDTDAFSFQALLRLGLATIPGSDASTDSAGNPVAATPSANAFNTFLGMRIENEGGHFEGAYLEIGGGESEQFTLKQVPRLRVDGLLPINDPGGWFRIATRLQVDMPRPYTKQKYEGKNLKGEIRLSFLFNLDLKELSHRLGVKTQ
jgi:hypothetical protein